MTILRSELYKKLHVGAENELKAAKIMLYDLVNKDARIISYGGKVAVSEGHTGVTSPSGKLPLADLRVEGADGANHQAKEAFIEHVGGPLSPNRDGTVAELAATCLRKFMDEVEKLKKSPEHCTVPNMAKEGWRDLSDVIGSYNQTIASLALTDKRYLAFSLREHQYANCKWLIKANGHVWANTQLNVEVPFRKIGVEGTDDIAIQFAGKESLFRACRSIANKMVDEVFIPIRSRIKAHQFHWSYHYEEPRGYKLRSLFTLYYFVVSVKLQTQLWEQRQKDVTHDPKYKIGDDKAKNMFGMLPKTNINDLVRTTLSDLDRKTLEFMTVDASQFKNLKARMNKDLDECLKDTLASHEMTNVNPHWYENYHVLVFQPGAGQRYKHESKKHYGNSVKPVIPSGPNNGQLTGTGKPLPTKFYDVKRDHDHKHVLEPTIVFEMRSGQLSAAGNDKFLEKDVVGTVLKQVASLQKSVPGRAG